MLVIVIFDCHPERRNSNGQKTHEKMLTISSHKGNANKNHTKIPLHPC
jgi:hypothetical protein